VEKTKPGGSGGLYNTMFEVIPAIMQVFQTGYLPAEDEFYELTPQQYEKFYAEVKQTNERLFMVLPKDPRFQTESHEIGVVTEAQISWFKQAGKIIERYCRDSGKTFKNFDEKLAYCATVMPKVFSDGSNARRSLLHEVAQSDSRINGAKENGGNI
jgi:hypothetical protein